MIKGDLFYWERGVWDEELVRNLTKAKAIILPQTVSGELYFLCHKWCPNIFPNYNLRFKWEGKVGDTMLFWSYGIPHPQTWIFPRVESLLGDHPAMTRRPKLPDYPFVIKGNRGGEGTRTWLIKDAQDLKEATGILKHFEMQGLFGFVIQEYVPRLDRDLRVVIVGDHIQSYWRCCTSGFLHNVAKGGEIDARSDLELQNTGKNMVRDLCDHTGINLAGFDLVFPDNSDVPLFLEINYTFGRAGLGGSDTFYGLLKGEIDKWLEACG